MRHIHVPDWTPTVLRYAAIGLVAPPALGKFLTYDASVRLFTTLGIPEPEAMVLVVGGLELAGVLVLLLNRRRWVAVLLLGPVMAVAAWTAREWQAVAVLLALAGVLAIDLGIAEVPPATTGGDQPADDTG